MRFQLELEGVFKYAFFFKGTNKEGSHGELDEEDKINITKGYMKKNYILVPIDDLKQIVIKNLGIKKKSNSPLSKKIFWEYMVPEIKKGTALFKKSFIQNIMLKLLNEDISLAAFRKDVGSYDQYAKTSPNSIQAQIAQKYGSGIHFMVPNILGRGVGKGKKYCTLEEFKENNMKMEHIDLSNFWKELDYFIKPFVTKNIFDFVK